VSVLPPVSVPLRGIGSEKRLRYKQQLSLFFLKIVSVPLRGIGSEKRHIVEVNEILMNLQCFRPLAGNRF